MPCNAELDFPTSLLLSLSRTYIPYIHTQPLPPLPDILPLGLKAPHDAALYSSSTNGVEAPYEYFPSWADLYPFLAGANGRRKWGVRRPAALFEVVEVRCAFAGACGLCRFVLYGFVVWSQAIHVLLMIVLRPGGVGGCIHTRHNRSCGAL